MWKIKTSKGLRQVRLFSYNWEEEYLLFIARIIKLDILYFTFALNRLTLVERST